MKKHKFKIFILALFVGFVTYMIPIEISKVIIPKFDIKASIQDTEIKVEEAYLEFRSEFIQCVLACDYSSITKLKTIKFKTINQKEIHLISPDENSQTFFKSGARLSECGVNILLIGRKVDQIFFSRINLYKHYSDKSKNGCSNKVDFSRLKEGKLGEGLNFHRWVGPISKDIELKAQ